MSWLETLRTGVDAIRTHRLRSWLTVLGILIGIAAVILTVGLGEGAQAQVTNEITALGTNLLTVTPGSSVSSTGFRSGLGTASTLTMEDAGALGSPTVAPDVASVAPTDQSTEQLVAGSSTWTTTAVGSTPRWLGVRGRAMQQGRFLDRADVTGHRAVAVLGPTTASELFSRADPVGQSVTVGGVPMTVVGVLQAVGSSSSSATTGNPDDQVVVPITTAAERLFGAAGDSLSSILVKARSSSALTAAYQETDAELLALHHIATPADADFQITPESSVISASTSADHTLTILLAGIAGLSLLVGGIGVMNIMLVSVAERTREIGLRKALGATPRLIKRQFLLEASILGLVGGGLGVVVGVLGRAFLPSLIGDPISLSPAALAAGVLGAIVVGLASGALPAFRAASLAPIDALRTE